MRLHIHLTRNTSPVPFDYQHSLAGVFHKWLGQNDLHDSISLYSISWLEGGLVRDGSLQFPNGAKFFVSFYEDTYAKSLVKGILNEPTTCFGMTVTEVNIQDTPTFTNRERFVLASPILIKRENGDQVDHVLWDDPEANLLLTKTLRHKMDKAGLQGDIDIRFDSSYGKPKTKLVSIKKIKNRSSICPVIIEGDSDLLGFAWNVGLGNGTGVGFGAVR